MTLAFFPSTQIDSNWFDEAIENSEFFAEYNFEGFYSFEEEEEMIDELEIILQKICDEHGINGYFEAF